MEVRYSIKRTSNLTWITQMQQYLNAKRKNFKNTDFLSSDSFYLGKLPAFLQKHFDNIALDIFVPNGEVKDAMFGKDASHQIEELKMYQLKEGMQNSVAVIYNNQNNSVLFITNLLNNDERIIVVGKIGQVDRKTAFEVKSIYSRKEMLPYLQKLSSDSIVYIQKEKEFNEIVKANQGQFPAPDFIIEFVDSITLSNADVNTDEQFSEKLSSDTADYVTRLQQENADLQAALEAAKAELKETRGLTITDKELRKISDFYADTLQSDLTRDELFRTLRGYFNYAADGGDLNVVLGTLTDLYMNAMQTSHSEMLWTELYDGQKEVLNDLRTNPVYLSEIQVQTVESNFDGYKNFQRASFGKIRFVKNHDGNHATLDARWSELCELSHGLLDVNTPDYAQPEALLDYYAATRPMWLDQGNPHGTTQQELNDAAFTCS